MGAFWVYDVRPICVSIDPHLISYVVSIHFFDTQCSLDALGNPDIFLNFQIWPYGEANPGISGWRASGIFS